MGRRKQIQEAKDIGVRLEASVIERLDRIADIAGVTRSQMIRNLVELGLDEAEALQAVGILSFARFCVDMRERLRGDRVKGAKPSTA